MKGHVMLLSGKQIIERNIIDNVGPKSVKEASYDLRVGCVFFKPKDPARSHTPVIRAESYELPPQGMVEVISLEKLTMPSNVLGYATVKTGLSGVCVLALGIG